MAEGDTVTEQRPRRRKRQKPVKDESGQLVTPVSGLPAAPINWAPPCRSCKTRTCNECGEESPHVLKACQTCGSEDLSEPHHCPDTISTGTVEGSVGTRQRVKCRKCGSGFSWTVQAKRI